MTRFTFPSFLMVIALIAPIAPAQEQVLNYDLIIRNGRIVDGSGKAAAPGDLAVKDGRIVAVGKVSGKAVREMDAAGLVVAPGFIDVHTHAEDIDDMPTGENFLRMGVTTIVLGNCGSSMLKVGDYFAQLEALTVSPNVATLIGHGTVRRRVMRGSFDRPPTEAEVEEMRQMVRHAMQEGAVGLSTGLIYMPGVFAKTEEIVQLAKAAAEYDGIYVTHQRSESSSIFQSLEEIFQVAREARVRAQVSHIKLSGPSSWNQAAQVLEAIEKARGEGLTVTHDQYAYTASSTGLAQTVPDWFKEGGRDKFLERFNTPELKAKAMQEMRDGLAKRKSPDFSYAFIASYRHDPSYNGLNVVEAARQMWGGESIDDQIETILEIEKTGGASAVFHSMSDADLETFMKHPKTMFASDSGVRRFQKDVPHPRGYGNNARVLGHYVREKKVISLEDAIRRMAALPAETFKLKDRGELRPGYWADVVVFDPDTVTDPSTFKDPHHYSTGFRYVLVNGVMVVETDQHTGARPGKMLRKELPREQVAGGG